MANKKIVLVISIIAIIAVLIIVAFKIKSLKVTYTFEEVSVEANEFKKDETKKEENSIQSNEIEDQNSISNEENNLQGNKQSKDENKDQNEEDTGENKESQESRESKAIDLAKKEWGEDDSVYYTIDRIVGDKYDICVRSKSTTESLAEYEVDIEKNTAVLK